MRRRVVLAVLAMTLGLAAPLCLAELILRLLPVRSAMSPPPVDQRDPIRRFAANQDFTFSEGWNFALVNRGHTNNDGFINDQDYDSTASSPLLAVIGDSFVEALMLPFRETIEGRLARCVGGSGRVYSFGVSGAPLSQYLVWASYAKARYHPVAFTIVIVGNDFDESLLRYKRAPGFHYFRDDSTGLTLQRIDYAPGLARSLARHSALARYVMLNVSGGAFVGARLKAMLTGQRLAAQENVGNTAARYSPERLESSRRALDRFLFDLPSRAGVEPHHIELVIDGMRPALYSAAGLDAAGGSFFDVMRRRLMTEADSLGYEVIDMQARFARRYATDGEPFEFPTDDHWNGRGHEEAARAVASSRIFQRVFPTACTSLVPEDERVARP